MKIATTLIWFVFAILIEVAIHAAGRGLYREFARKYGLTWFLVIIGLAAVVMSVVSWSR